jgi:hypothetical protein
MSETHMVPILTNEKNLFDTTPLKKTFFAKISSEYASTINEINDILARKLQPVQLDDDKIFQRAAILTIIIFLGCLLLFLAPFLQWPYYTLFERDQQMFFIILGSQCAFLLLAIAVVLYWLTSSKKKMLTVKSDIQTVVENVLKKHNKDKYLSKGIQWEFEWSPATTGIREEADPQLYIYYNE